MLNTAKPPQFRRSAEYTVLGTTMSAWVTLMSDVRGGLMQDGYRFVVDRKWAELSGTIKTMLSMDSGGMFTAHSGFSEAESGVCRLQIR